MSILLLKQLVYRRGNSYLQDRHLAAIEGAREESTLLLRNFYKVWEKVHVLCFLFSFGSQMPGLSADEYQLAIPVRFVSLIRTLGLMRFTDCPTPERHYMNSMQTCNSVTFYFMKN